MRVLFIARYHTESAHRKVEHIARAPDMQIRQICPMGAENPGMARMVVEEATGVRQALERMAVPMWGDPKDPHRAMYRTLTFGMPGFRPHIIHAEEEPDSLAALQIALARRLFAPRAKLILHTWQNLDRPKSAAVRMVLRATLRAADAILCANQEAMAILGGWGYTRPTAVIPAIGVDTELFRPCRPPRNGFHIVYVGRLVPEKGLETLLDALALLIRHHPTWPVDVTLIGSGPYEPVLRERATRLHLVSRVHFAGPMTQTQLARLLCGFHALVLPSRTTRVWKEQLGRVLVEAMAAGVPVIGSDSGAIPAVIDRAGLIFPEGDARALAAHLERLVADPTLWAELRRRGLVRAQDYSQVELAARTLAFYRELIP